MGPWGQAQGHPTLGHGLRAEQGPLPIHRGTRFSRREWGAQLAPVAEGSSPSWWELAEIVSRAQMGQRSR